MNRTNRTLAIAALILASLALVAGESSRRVTVDPEELAYRIQNELDHVDPLELSDWISTKREGYRLIDLRTPEEFARYHIPGAANTTLPELIDMRFRKTETIVLYSEGGIHSAQAMFLLWTKGYDNVFMLKGGIAAWEADVLHKRPRPKSDDQSHPADTVKKTPPKKPNLKEEEKFRREC
jgi:rhodanese-related sulfurtransferase